MGHNTSANQELWNALYQGHWKPGAESPPCSLVKKAASKERFRKYDIGLDGLWRQFMRPSAGQ